MTECKGGESGEWLDVVHQDVIDDWQLAGDHMTKLDTREKAEISAVVLYCC